MSPFDKVEELLRLCVVELQRENPVRLRSHDGAKFEKLLQAFMERVIDSNAIFGDVVKVERISGQRFPDIVVEFPSTKVGVEVKTTTGNKWQTLGGSIFESTRVEGVEEIFLFFAKLGEQIDYRYGPHEQYLKDVLITHKPRYSIDMETEAGNTIFSKIGMSYDQVRGLSNPFKPFREYLKEKAGPGADLWWIGDEDKEGEDINSFTAPAAFIPLRTLDDNEIERIESEVCVLFPEIFNLSGEKTKYYGASTYLAARYRIVDHALRDRFTAGGKVKIFFQGGNYSVPQVISRLADPEFLQLVHDFISGCDISILAEYWGKEEHQLVSLSDSDKFKLWVEMVMQAVRQKDTGIPDCMALIYTSLESN